jgi:hypothetical protein
MITHGVPVLLGTSIDCGATARHEYAVEALISRDCGKSSLTPIPLNDSPLAFLNFSVSTGALCKDGSELVVLLSCGEKSADPDDLLQTLFFANLKDDLLSVTELVGR